MPTTTKIMDTASVFDADIELPGVDAGEIKAPQKVEIYDLNIPGDPDPVQIKTVKDEAVKYQAPAVQATKAVQTEPIPDGPLRSARIRTWAVMTYPKIGRALCR